MLQIKEKVTFKRTSVVAAVLAQVRRPIYKSSIARWRHYEKHLEPLTRRLQDAGIDCS